MTNPFAAAIEELRWILDTTKLPLRRKQIEASLRVLEAAAQLTFEDKTWLANRVDLAIAEYVPIIDGMTCPGRVRKDRFRALLAALPDPAEGEAMTKTEKALHTLGLYIADDELKSNAREALATLREAVTDYEKAKAEGESLTEALDIAAKAYATLKARAEKAEAAHIKDLEHIKARDDSFGVLLDSNIRLEAELEKARPLLEAVMGAKLFPAPTDGRTCIDSHEKIIRQALAYKEQHER